MPVQMRLRLRVQELLYLVCLRMVSETVDRQTTKLMMVMMMVMMTTMVMMTAITKQVMMVSRKTGLRTEESSPAVTMVVRGEGVRRWMVGWV